MKRIQDSDTQFEQLLRVHARHAYRPAPQELAPRVLSEIGRREDTQRTMPMTLQSRWYPAVLAAGITLAATLIAAVMLRPAADVRGPLPGETRAKSHEMNDATGGPMAMFASLQRAPDDVGTAIRDAVGREMNLLMEDILSEPKQFLARLPMQGRIDHDADRIP